MAEKVNMTMNDIHDGWIRFKHPIIVKHKYGSAYEAVDVKVAGRPLMFLFSHKVGETQEIGKGPFKVNFIGENVVVVDITNQTPDIKIDERTETIMMDRAMNREEVIKELGLKNYEFGFTFEKLNPMQMKVIQSRAIQDNNNLIVSAPTASGKTLVAELAIAKALDNYSTAIYIAPAKALADEKSVEFSEGTFKEFQVEAITGDMYMKVEESEDGELSVKDTIKWKMEQADILVMTPEMLSSKVTKVNNYQFLDEVGVVVVDEVHLIGSEGRGDVIEAMLVQLLTHKPDIKVVLLSATISDLDVMGDWIQSVTHRKTVIVESDYRPTKLKIEYINFADGYYADIGYEIRVGMVYNMIKAFGGKWLVFCSSREATKSVAEAFKKLGLTAEYHNAALEYKKRKEVEKRFMEGDLQVLVATTTLALGVNTPARYVVIMDTMRGQNLIDGTELLQCAGRAGRPKYDKEGTAYIMASSDIIDRVKSNIANVKVKSRLIDPVVMKMHMNNMVYQGIVNDLDTLEQVMQSSLAYYNDDKGTESVWVNSLKWLKNNRYIMDRNGTYEPLWKGKVAAIMYQNPLDIEWWLEKVNALSGQLRNNDIKAAYALTKVTDIKDANYVSKTEGQQMAKWEAKNGYLLIELYDKFGVFSYPVEAKHTWIIWNAMNGNPDNVPYSTIANLRMDIDRIVATIKMLVKDKSIKEDLDVIKMRIRYGVPEEYIGIVQLKGIGKSRAEALIRAGIKDLEAIVNNKEKVIMTLGKKVGEDVYNQALMLRMGGNSNEP